MQIDAAEALARQLMREHGLAGWKFAWSKSKRAFGSCCEGRKVIKLSRHLVTLNDYTEVLDTILHEIAHAIAGHKAGHGPEWQQVAIRLGCRPQATYDAATTVSPIPRYQLICSSCFKVWSLERRPKHRYTCRGCSTIHRKQLLQLYPTSERLYINLEVETALAEKFALTLRMGEQIAGRILIDKRWVACVLEGERIRVERKVLPTTFVARYPRAMLQDAVFQLRPDSQNALANILRQQ